MKEQALKLTYTAILVVLLIAPIEVTRYQRMSRGADMSIDIVLLDSDELFQSLRMRRMSFADTYAGVL